MSETRKSAALEVAESLLTEIELSRIDVKEAVMKASRIARLTDDTVAMEWFRAEMEGYPRAKNPSLKEFARRVGRAEKLEDGKWGYRDQPLSVFVSLLEIVDKSKGQKTKEVYDTVFAARAVVAGLETAVYQWCTEKQIELRFGAVAESAFDAVRRKVDQSIAELVPDAAIKLAAAFENASSENPEHWANAASECRRLLKALADELRPAGEATNGISMNDDKYINRLVSWISEQTSVGSTLRTVVTTDLEDFGKRIDAFDSAGHKGAHGEVSKYEASRFVTGAYLLIGDILDLRNRSAPGDMPER